MFYACELSQKHTFESNTIDSNEVMIVHGVTNPPRASTSAAFRPAKRKASSKPNDNVNAMIQRKKLITLLGELTNGEAVTIYSLQSMMNSSTPSKTRRTWTGS